MQVLDDESSIATKFASEVGTAVFDTVVGTAIGGPILSFLGLGSDTPDYTAYFTKINTELSNLQSDINKDMAVIQQGIAQIKNAITALTSDLQDAELQAALEAYTPHKNTIVQNYTTLGDAIAGLASADMNVRNQAIKTTFDLLSNTLNVDAVSAALLNIHDLLQGNGELKGIIQYQPEVCYNNVTHWATVPANIAREWRLDYVPMGGADYSRVLLQYSSILESALLQTVLPNLRAMLAVQIQGLSFLISAWGGTSQGPQLVKHANDIRSQIQSMTAIFSSLNDEVAIDAFIENLISSIGSPVAANVTQFFAVNVDDRSGTLESNWNAIPWPFALNWIPWGEQPPSGDQFVGWPNEPDSARYFPDCIIQTPIQWNSPTNSIVHIGALDIGPGYFYTNDAANSTNALIPLPRTFRGSEPNAYATVLRSLASIEVPELNPAMDFAASRPLDRILD